MYGERHESVREDRQGETELSKRQRDSEGKEIVKGREILKGKETAQGTQDDVKIQQRANETQALYVMGVFPRPSIPGSVSVPSVSTGICFGLSTRGYRVSLWHKASFQTLAHHIRWTQYLTRSSCAIDLPTIPPDHIAMPEVEELTREQIDALLDKAVDQVDHELYAEAAATTRAVLEHRLSRWPKIYAIALLADCLDDWYDAEVSSTPFHVLESVTTNA